jgi:arylsulfatase A-like enzyme
VKKSLLKFPARARRIFEFVLVLSLCVSLSGCRGSSDLAGAYKGYNLILIIADALRPDHLSCYGYREKTSEHIDSLAKEGVIFKNAFSQAPITLPSVVSIFTSLYPFSHRVRLIYKDILPSGVPTLAQVLTDYGYSTVWFGDKDDPHSAKAPGVLNGFNEIYGIREAPGIFRWIEAHQGEPFFITIHSYSTHEGSFPFSKYDNKFSQRVPEDIRRAITTASQKAWSDFQDQLKNNPEPIYDRLGREWLQKYKDYFLKPFSQELLDRIFALIGPGLQKVILWEMLKREPCYSAAGSFSKEQMSQFLFFLDAAIFELDKGLIGGITGKLKMLNLYDRTIIIITADHGNEFLEHGHIGHTRGALYDESIRVPLIFYLPGLEAAIQVEELVQSIDILPTVLDLLGIPIPHQTQGISLAGIMGGKRDAPRNEYVLSEGRFQLGIRSRDWKLILLASTGEIKDTSGAFPSKLFDLQRDKYEKNNLIETRQDISEDLKSRLLSRLHSLPVYQTQEREFIPGLDEETKRRIIKTGYW